MQVIPDSSRMYQRLPKDSKSVYLYDIFGELEK